MGLSGAFTGGTKAAAGRNSFCSVLPDIWHH